ncbi:Rod shape-determining protein MreD [Granulicella sibirica]|uniref:Rod shape-determining protein MreD n=2 Tax=Granulicella sibirica TaxID=2479048 RepID=A0A4Q0T2N4_9BACT|nr:Rod shape-determining protein MreD [Granulicella sibirica]
MTLLVPLAAILLQVLLPKAIPKLAILDLPLIATIFFAVARRSPIAGTLTGALIGLMQDALTNQPIGVNGMAKCVIGYIAASIGVKVDVENIGTRVLMNFAFSLLESVLLYLIQSRLLGLPGFHLLWLHEVIRALANTAVALPVFLFLDRGKRMI